MKRKLLLSVGASSLVALVAASGAGAAPARADEFCAFVLPGSPRVTMALDNATSTECVAFHAALGGKPYSAVGGSVGKLRCEWKGNHGPLNGVLVALFTPNAKLGHVMCSALAKNRYYAALTRIK